jgi:hypothetical protein
MKHLLLILPLAACTPHVETCLTFPLPVGCQQSGGGGLSLLAGGNVPPKPDPGPAPAPEPKPEPPKPKPKPHHHDDDDHDDDERGDDYREHDDDD